MALNRTNFNLLVDDDGTNLTGTIWDKAHIKDVILDPIDSELVVKHGSFQVVTDTATRPMTITGSDGGASGSVLGLYSNVSGRECSLQFSDAFTYNLSIGSDAAGGFNVWAGRFPGVAGVARFTVTASGAVLIGAAAVVQSARLMVAASASVNNIVVIQNLYSGDVGNFALFVNAAGLVAGAIGQVSATTVAYNTTSDQRLKTDYGIAHDLTALRQIVIHDFVWTDHDTPDRGVFAQEAVKVCPRAITVGSDGADLSRPWMVDYSKFVPDLIVGWQQHDARIAALEARLKE